MQINESIEDYLEMILILIQKKGYARSIDIASELSVTKPSVSHATKLLRSNDYIIMDKNSHIFLTDAGSEIAERMLERHKLLSSFLIRLGVDKNTAFRDACKMEHDISRESFEAICRYVSLNMPDI